jgi:hypothetical protein
MAQFEAQIGGAVVSDNHSGDITLGCDPVARERDDGNQWGPLLGACGAREKAAENGAGDTCHDAAAGQVPHIGLLAELVQRCGMIVVVVAVIS